MNRSSIHRLQSQRPKRLRWGDCAIIGLLLVGQLSAAASSPPPDGFTRKLDPEHTRQLLAAQTWRLVAWQVTRPDGAKMNFLEAVKPCKVDDHTQYQLNGTYRITEGETGCQTQGATASADREVGTGRWKLLSNKAGQLTLSEEFLGGKSVKRTVRSISEESLTLELTSESSGHQVWTYVTPEKAALQELDQQLADQDPLARILTEEITELLRKRPDFFVRAPGQDALGSDSTSGGRVPGQIGVQVLPFTNATTDTTQQQVILEKLRISAQPSDSATDLLVSGWLTRLDRTPAEEQPEKEVADSVLTLEYELVVWDVRGQKEFIRYGFSSTESTAETRGGDGKRRFGAGGIGAGIYVLTGDAGGAITVGLAVQVMEDFLNLNVYLSDMAEDEKLDELQAEAAKQAVYYRAIDATGQSVEDSLKQNVPRLFPLLKVLPGKRTLLEARGIAGSSLDVRKNAEMYIVRYHSQGKSWFANNQEVIAKATVKSVDRDHDRFVAQLPKGEDLPIINEGQKGQVFLTSSNP